MLYRENLSSHSAFHPRKAVYDEFLTLSCIPPIWFKSSLYSECQPDSSLWNRLSSPVPTQWVWLVLYLTHFPTQNIAPNFHFFSCVNSKFCIWFRRWLIVSLGNYSQGKRQKYSSANWLSLKKSGQTPSKSGTAPQTGDTYTDKFIMLRNVRAMAFTFFNSLKHWVVR